MAIVCIIWAIFISAVGTFIVIDQPVKDHGITISYLFDTIPTSKDVREYSVIQTAKLSESVSVQEVATDMVSNFTSISTYTDIADLYLKCEALSKSVQSSQEKQVLITPEDAASIDLEEAGVYQWTNTYHTRITNRTSSESFFCIRLQENIIQVVCGSRGKSSATMEINTYRIISTE